MWLPMENKKCEYYSVCKRNTKFHCTHLNQLHTSQAHCTIRTEFIELDNFNCTTCQKQKSFPKIYWSKIKCSALEYNEDQTECVQYKE